jgi:ABC-type hemin transport system ATPase subunit
MATELASMIREFEADHAWISDNLTALMARYEDQWIAVKNGRVIASSPDLDVLISTIPDPPRTCVEFITRDPLEMVL